MEEGKGTAGEQQCAHEVERLDEGLKRIAVHEELFAERGDDEQNQEDR